MIKVSVMSLPLCQKAWPKATNKGRVDLGACGLGPPSQQRSVVAGTRNSMDHKQETETANLKRHKPYKPQSDICPQERIHILSLPKHPPTGDQVVKCPNCRELAFKLLQRVGGVGCKEVLTKNNSAQNT